MKHIQNLSELLAEQLRTVLSSEQQQKSIIPDLSMKTKSRDLTKTLHDYRKTKEHNINKLNQCIAKMDIKDTEGKCNVTQKLVENCTQAISRSAKDYVLDATLIATIQQINHLNMANYGTASSYARTLHQEDVAQILHSILNEEKAADDHLSRIAEETINPAAVPA